MYMRSFFRRMCRRSVTRSFGFLEFMLSRARARKAHTLIARHNLTGIALDIGCGSYPIFLLTSAFIKKYGIDQKQCDSRPSVKRRVQYTRYTIDRDCKLPFDTACLSVVTLLAVLEHIDLKSCEILLQEIYRVLKPGGQCIITIPAVWSEHILRILAYLHMISSVEMKEHKTRIHTQDLKALLIRVGFERVSTGTFECGMNRWFLAERMPSSYEPENDSV